MLRHAVDGQFALFNWQLFTSITDNTDTTTNNHNKLHLPRDIYMGNTLVF